MPKTNINSSEQEYQNNLFENRFYNKKEVARKLNVCLRMIDNLMKSGDLKPVYLGRAVRFNGNDLNGKFGNKLSGEKK